MSWPAIMLPLLDRYGELATWDAGIEALGYPATWIHTHKEARAVGARARENEQDTQNGPDAKGTDMRMGAEGINSPDDLQRRGPAPGRYHVMILDADESGARGNAVIVDFEVLAGTIPGQEGKTFQEWFSLSPKAMPRLQRLALVAQLLAPGAPEQEVEFEAAVGRELVVELEENSYTTRNGDKRTSTRISWMGLWAPDHPDVADVPRGKAIMPAGESDGGSQAGGASAGDGGWGDL